MTAPVTFIDFVSSVIDDIRDLTPRDTIELGVIHGFCVDAAQARRPHFIEFLSDAGSLAALSAALAQLPHKVTSVDVTGAAWRLAEQAPELSPRSRDIG